MSRKIFRNILFTSIVVLLSGMIFIFGGFYHYFDDRQEENLKKELNTIVSGLERFGMDYLMQTDFGVYRITLISPEGEVVYDTQADEKTMVNHGSREEIQEAREKRTGSEPMGICICGTGGSVRYSSTLLEKTVYYAERMEDGSVLRISQTSITLGAIVLGMQQPVMLVLMIALVLSAVLALRLSENIVKPINRLNLEEPLANEVYEELEPLLKRIDKQNHELKRAYTLAQQDRIEFTANVTHELKTPLQSIMGTAELIENGLIRQEDLPGFASRMRQEAARMVTLVEDIIKLSQLDEGDTLPLESVNLYEVAQEVRSMLEEAAKKKQIVLRLDGTGVMVTGVYRLLMEVLYNLCDNAIKYNRNGGTVSIETGEEGPWAKITVRDTGIGIPPEDQCHVFERFYRVDKSRSKSSGGTGLGLSIVKHAVQYHNGEIKLKSRPGEGTEITVLLQKRLSLLGGSI